MQWEWLADLTFGNMKEQVAFFLLLFISAGPVDAAYPWPDNVTQYKGYIDVRLSKLQAS